MKDVLVYANSLSAWTPAMIWAAQIASTLRGGLTGVYVCPSPAVGYAAPYGGIDIAASLIASIRKVEEEAYAVHAQFERRAAEYGVRSAQWQVAEGHVPQILQHLGNWHDLLVIDRGNEAPWTAPWEVGNLVLTTRMPTLVVPPGAPQRQSLDCVAIAWNGSPEALRALHAARGLLAQARRIVVLQATRGDRTRRSAGGRCFRSKPTWRGRPSAWN
ncbi:hypothetical protein PEC18_05340 [Paucibacter sp. O1-1]|nr:hypothetical protein [Paucibacter sp. O1-1]MDA3825293.1 hypothetical protein [Paucibacter sp. O1-1]